MSAVKSLAFLAFLLPPVYASGNPFAASGGRADASRGGAGGAVFAGKVVSVIAPLQAKISARLSRLMKSAGNENSVGALVLAVLVSFLYGLVHAAGPGHGKTLLFSYFVAEGGGVKKGVAASFAVMFMQAFSAIVLVSAIYLTLRHSYTGSFEKFSNMIKLLSYTLITVIGAGLLIKAVFLRSSPSGNNTKSARAAGILPLVFSIGIIPCPGVAILLIFAASLHFLRLGIFLALVMALGMACTVSAVAFATITARKRLGFFAEDGEKKRKAEKFMELTGALLIFALGLFFLIGNL